MTIISADSTRAQQALAWLHGLDEIETQRAELRASGVAPATIEALYPLSFDAIVPPLVRHLKGLDSSKLGYLGGEIRDHFSDVRRAGSIAARDKAIDAQYEQERTSQWVDSEIEGELKTALREIFSAARLNVGHASFAATTLWYIWWLGQKRSRLTSEALTLADASTCWYAEHILQLPEFPEQVAPW